MTVVTAAPGAPNLGITKKLSPALSPAHTCNEKIPASDPESAQYGWYNQEIENGPIYGHKCCCFQIFFLALN
jgi:hypothetical protein